MKIYSTAWEKGLKSTYYLHMKPRHTAEQSTTNVNKAQKMGKVGFGALNFAASPAFSAPLQKSLTMDVAESTPQTTPKVSPIVEPIKTISTEEIIVSTTTYKDNTPAVTTTLVEEVKVVEEYRPAQPVNEAPRNEYKPLESVGAKKMNIIYPEDPADGDNVCIACQ
jgi:ribonucleoside-diphosphate reductase alpha chain